MLNSHPEAPGVVASRLPALGCPLGPILVQKCLEAASWPSNTDGESQGEEEEESQKALVEGPSASPLGHLLQCHQATPVFSLAASRQGSPDDPAHCRSVAGDRQRVESGKDQNFPEGEPLNTLVLSLLEPMGLVSCPP